MRTFSKCQKRLNHRCSFIVLIRQLFVTPLRTPPIHYSDQLPTTPGARASCPRKLDRYKATLFLDRQLDLFTMDIRLILNPGDHDKARERSTSLTSPHLRQLELEYAKQTRAEYDRTPDYHRSYGESSAAVRTPGSGYLPNETPHSGMNRPPSLPPSAVSPSIGPSRRAQAFGEGDEMSPLNGRPHDIRAGREGSAQRSYDSHNRDESLRDEARGLTRRESSAASYHGLHVSDYGGHASRQRQSSAASYHDPYVSGAEYGGHAYRESYSSPGNGLARRPSVATSSSQIPLPQTDEEHRYKDHARSPESIEQRRASVGEADTVTKEVTDVEPESQSVVVDENRPAPLPRYAPSRRVSKPTGVMRPIGIEEIDRKRTQCRNPLRREWEQQHHTDSRKPLDDILRDFHERLAPGPVQSGSNGGEKTSTDAKKRAIGETLEDAEEVADHYNKRREVGIHGREESPIIALRKFNNWIKSVLIGTFARGPRTDPRGRPRGGRILELGCGKGGDLKKWQKVQPSGLVGADIAAVSIEQAVARHRENPRSFPAEFFAFDCFSLPLAEVIPRELLEPMFDNVTLQFCMHYAWESVQKARIMLDNVSRYLCKGGIFIGTIPDSRELRDRMAHSPHPEDRSFGNRYYKVVFDQIDTFPAFGNRYTFFLEDAVENVPEYVVDFAVFEELAYEVGLRCIYRKNFAEIYEEGSRHDEHGRLLEKMNVVDRYGSLNLDEEMWQAATLYLGFAFEKM